MNGIHVRIFTSVLGLCVSLSFFSCSKEGDVLILAPPSVESKVQAGWSDYMAGNYESAVNHFESALTQDAALYDAYNGLGWSYFRRGEFSQAIDYFQFLVPLRDTDSALAADAYAGLAAVYMTQDDDVNAILSAWEALSLAGESYTFSHDPSITAEDLHTLAARCLYNIGEFFLSHVEINATDPSFPPPSLIFTITVVETVTATDSVDIEMSYTSSTPTLHFNTAEFGLIRIFSVTDLAGQTEYEVLYAYGEMGDVFLTAEILPPVGTRFIVEYAYVEDYHEYLIVLAEKIESLAAF